MPSIIQAKMFLVQKYIPHDFSCFSCLIFSLYRPKKAKYPLQYKVRVINPDGSSYFTRYHLPVGVIRLAVDPNSLTEEERKARLKKLRRDETVETKEYKEQVKFDRRALMNMMKKKK